MNKLFCRVYTVTRHKKNPDRYTCVSSNAEAQKITVQKVRCAFLLDPEESPYKSRMVRNWNTILHLFTVILHQPSETPSTYTPRNSRKFHRESSASPLRNASRARTSVTYCSPSKIGMRCKRSLSVGSLIQPSIGIALSTFKTSVWPELIESAKVTRTFVKDIA